MKKLSTINLLKLEFIVQLNDNDYRSTLVVYLLLIMNVNSINKFSCSDIYL